MNLEVEEIYPKIFVYKNMFSDLDNTTQTIINSEKNPEGSALSGWHSWYTFGSEMDMFDYSIEETERTKNESKIWQEIINIFYKTTEHYSNYFNIPINKDEFVFNQINKSETELWRRMGPSFCKYEPGSGVTEDLAMHYHTDYQVERKDERGYKFAITCTMYLNDNYKGGGIDFYINKKLFYYKPKAGDVIVFPSGDPNIISDKDELYHHGVKKCFDFPKYFIRNNWTYFYPGSEEWIKNESFYGEEIWKKMEDDRNKEGKSKGLYQFINEKEIREAVRIQ